MRTRKVQKEPVTVEKRIKMEIRAFYADLRKRYVGFHITQQSCVRVRDPICACCRASDRDLCPVRFNGQYESWCYSCRQAHKYILSAWQEGAKAR